MKILRMASWWMMVAWFLFYNVLTHRPTDAPAVFASVHERFLLAASQHNFSLQEKWLKRGADINVQDSSNAYGYTALQKVVAYDLHTGFMDGKATTKGLDEIKFLLKHGADPNVRGWDGQTALQIAAAYEERQAIALLKQHGATR